MAEEPTPISFDKIKQPPPVLGRFMAVDDDGSYISEEKAIPDPAPPVSDEYVMGGGDPPRRCEYTDAVDREDMFRKVVNYSAVMSRKVDFLSGETVQEDEEEKRMLMEIAASGVKYDFTGINQSHANAAVRNNPCSLCHMITHELKDADPESAFLAAKIADLKMCGWASEPAVIQAVSNIYNDKEQENAIRMGREPVFVTSVEVRDHFYYHDNSNIKRAIVLDSVRSAHLARCLFEASVGVTADGQRVVRGGVISQYQAVASRANGLSADFLHRSMFVNMNMFGEEPLTGEPNLRRGKVDGGGGKQQKRFAGVSTVSGKKKKTSL